MRLWGRPKIETPDPETRDYRLDDSATAVLLGADPGYTGESVNVRSALTVTAYYRAKMLVTQAIAGLPLKTYMTTGDGERERVASIYDNPAGRDSITPYEWKEQVAASLFDHANAYLFHLRNNQGALVGLEVLPPSRVSVHENPDAAEGKEFWVELDDGSQEKLTTAEILHIPGPNFDGLIGHGPLTYGRNALGEALASQRASQRMFKNGPLIGGMIVPLEPITDEDAEEIGADLDRHMFGAENAGRWPLVNRMLDFKPWMQSNVDAQWLETRKYSIEEVARLTGVPPFLLMDIEKQTSWGTGVAMQNKLLAQYVLDGYCRRIEQRLSRLIDSPTAGRFVEFDMAGLLQGSADEVSALLLAQVNGGLLTPNEARRIMNLGPVDGGDELRVPSGVMLTAQLEADVVEGDPGV